MFRWISVFWVLSQPFKIILKESVVLLIQWLNVKQHIVGCSVDSFFSDNRDLIESYDLVKHQGIVACDYHSTFGNQALFTVHSHCTDTEEWKLCVTGCFAFHPFPVIFSLVPCMVPLAPFYSEGLHKMKWTQSFSKIQTHTITHGKKIHHQQHQKAGLTFAKEIGTQIRKDQAELPGGVQNGMIPQ